MKKTLARMGRVARSAGMLLVVSSIAAELLKPADLRVWHGRLFGVVPYDWRRPTPKRLRHSVWDPDNPRLLTDRSFGVGWSINFHQLWTMLRPHTA